MESKFQIGQKLHKLTIQEIMQPKNWRCKITYNCLCDCGKLIIVKEGDLITSHTKSCGCIRYEDLTGRKFEKLTVIKRLPSKHNNSYWECLCECGKTTEAQRSHLLNNAVKSCGCLRTKHHPMMSSALEVYNFAYKEENGISFEDFLSLSQENCYYCGNPSSNSYGRKNRKRSSIFYKNNCVFNYNGLDRIDNTKLHTKENCIPCCKICNFRKRNLSINEFFSMIKNINENCKTIVPNYNDIYLNRNKENDNNFLKYKKVHSSFKKAYSDTNFDKDILYFIMSLECFYCGKLNSCSAKTKNGTVIVRNGIDRINQNEPHSMGNIVPCCKGCNFSKGKLSMKEYIDWANKSYRYLFGLGMEKRITDKIQQNKNTITTIEPIEDIIYSI